MNGEYIKYSNCMEFYEFEAMNEFQRNTKYCKDRNKM